MIFLYKFQAFDKKHRIGNTVRDMKQSPYKQLLAIEDPDIPEEYYDKTIMPLITYDQEHGANLYALVIFPMLKSA